MDVDVDVNELTNSLGPAAKPIVAIAKAIQSTIFYTAPMLALAGLITQIAGITCSRYTKTQADKGSSENNKKKQQKEPKKAASSVSMRSYLKFLPMPEEMEVDMHCLQYNRVKSQSAVPRIPKRKAKRLRQHLVSPPTLIFCGDHGGAPLDRYYPSLQQGVPLVEEPTEKPLNWIGMRLGRW